MLAGILQSGNAHFALGLLAASSYQSNPRLLKPDDLEGRTDGFGVIASGGMRSQRTRLNAYGFGNLARSAQVPDLDRTAYGGRLDVYYRSTPRVSFSGTLGVRSALAVELLNTGATLNSGTTTGGGTSGGPSGGTGGSSGGTAGGGLLALPTAKVRVDDAGAFATVRLSTRSTWNLQALANQTSYATSALLGGRSVSLRSMLDHRFSPGFTSDVRVQGSNTSSSGPALPGATTTSIEVGGTSRFSFAQLRLLGGAFRLWGAGLAATVGTVANVTLSRAGNRGYVSVYADHRVGPSFGMDRMLTNDVIGLDAGRSFGRSTMFALTAQKVQNSAPTSSTFMFSSINADATLRQQVAGFVVLTTGVFYRQRSDRTTVQNVGVSASMAVLAR